VILAELGVAPQRAMYLRGHTDALTVVVDDLDVTLGVRSVSDWRTSSRSCRAQKCPICRNFGSG
jgi:hypothetical protein